MKRRYTTRQQDAEYLLRRIEDARHDWKIGDECRPYRGEVITKIARIEGDIIYLENGESMHRSHMRRPE